MRIFHIATVTDWDAARVSGRYTTSTRGRSLAEEGFIHASRGDQWQGVRERFYADVEEPLVLLVIDTEALTAPVIDEAVPDSTETFPHIYGALNVDAVLTVTPLDHDATAAPREPSASLSSLFLSEFYRQIVLGGVVLVVVLLGTVAGIAGDTDWSPLAGIVAGLALGLLFARAVKRRQQW
ncbi:hypothetical protein BH11ACT8_BH11ACT8_08510 [soil metagenome]